ncbi:MAG: hypothetical protein U5K43_04295 [Halofilum sp. (in: g-proteobacteria)]|nr:hypothetical protein [Halofilum sp. (in: g-proteobacteria)]
MTAAAEREVIVEAATLRDGPGASASPVTRLEAGTEVAGGARRGAWLAVETRTQPRRSGWVRVWRVRSVPADEDDGNPILNGLKRFSRSVAGLFGGDSGSQVEQGNVTATIGVRGLKPGEFASASPDPAARERLATVRASGDEARAFAREAGLDRREIGAVGAGAGQAQDWGEW